MAPAVLASPAGTGTYQAAFCSGIDTLKQWQANKKTLVASGSGSLGLHARSSQMASSMSTCISLSSFDLILGTRRWSGVMRNARKNSARRLSTAAIANSFVVEEAEVGMGSDDKTDEAVPAAAKEGEPGVPVKEKFKPRVPGQKARRESPKVLAEALVPGAVFPGVVSTIQPFGAFVNFGAFTDGLVHISKLSNGYVTNVSDIVTIGQAVNVTILSVEQSSGRIALSMVDQKPATEGAGNVEAREGGSRLQQGSDGRPVNRGRTAGGGSGRQPRRDEPKKITTKLVKGQEVDGTIKNKIRSGVFVEIPEEEDGFLRYSDIPGGENMSPESAIQVGQKIKATVMKIDRGRIVLTMKPTVDLSSINRDINKGQDVLAANPFEIAFRAFNFVPEEATQELEQGRVEPVFADESFIPEVPAAVEEGSAAGQEFIPKISAAVPEAPEAQVVVAAAGEVGAPVEEKVVPEVETVQGSVDDIVSEATDALATSVLEEEVGPEASLTIDDGQDTVPIAVVETPSGEEVVVPEAIAEEVAGAVGEATVEEVLPESIPAAFAEVEEAPVGVEEVIPELEATVASVAAVEEANLETRGPPGVPVPDEVLPETAIAEEARFERKIDQVSAALVKELRDETGAGMMNCKRALAESGGDMDKAREALRKKGLASADKKANRIASEGLVGSYVHDSRVGVLVELNCETDFVSRGHAFKSLVEDVGMQIVASQQVQYVSVEDIPPEVVNKEKELEAHRDDLTSKPEAIRGRIVEGRVLKRLNDIALLEQPYIRDDKIFLKDVVKQTVATLGENIKVRRFERYVLGEGLEKKSGDFAAEVAAQTATMKVAEPPKAEETPAPDVHSPAVIVSAGLVKELRAQTGAGMMDCKKALAANENDLVKAVESLRKKGLASADKKASRIASEGLIGTYVHDGRIGILIEVNCETDFVARGDTFKDLVETLAMQAAAYPLVQVVSVEDVPAEVVAKEKEIESGKEDLASKPEAIRDRIVDGRVSKRLAELALLEQPFIKDDKKLVKDIVRETIATLGEKIQVRRFTRFNLGEGIQKRAVDFAGEVAAQMQV